MLTLALLTACVAAIRGLWSPCGLSVLTSINPVSETARGNRFAITALYYLAGALVGGAVLGLLCAAGAATISALGLSVGVCWTITAAVAVVALASDTGVARHSLPVHPRQLDERWLTAYRRWIYATGFGVQIGTGFATYIMTAAVYLTVALAALTASPAAGFAVGVVFGGVRGLTVLVAAFTSTPQALRSVHRRVELAAPWSLRSAVTAEFVVLAVALATALSGGQPTVSDELTTAVLLGVGGVVTISIVGVRRLVRASGRDGGPPAAVPAANRAVRPSRAPASRPPVPRIRTR